jgi:hypothetical protein
MQEAVAVAHTVLMVAQQVPQHTVAVQVALPLLDLMQLSIVAEAAAVADIVVVALWMVEMVVLA